MPESANGRVGQSSFEVFPFLGRCIAFAFSWYGRNYETAHIGLMFKNTGKVFCNEEL
jgi:hypothetical protein